MLNNKNILVNGCSFSRGPNSWPYYLEESYNFNLVNLAQAGAGNSYIQESTVEELSKRKYDFVIIMWSGLSRIDYKVENINLFDQNKYTSRYQKTRNDWPGKIIFPINDQEYVDDSWVFGCGVVNNDTESIKNNLFTGIYKNLGYNQFIYHSLQKIIGLQSFLKSFDIPYLFTFYQDYQKDLQKEKELYGLLDQSNMYINENIWNIAKKLNDIDDTPHPGLTTHKEWANLIKRFIDAKN
jgi:hypothetical protein